LQSLGVALEQLRILGLGNGRTSAVGVKAPTVVAALQLPALDPAFTEGGQAVRTVIDKGAIGRCLVRFPDCQRHPQQPGGYGAIRDEIRNR